MWVLLIITLAALMPDGTVLPELTTKLESYRTLQDCDLERIRITKEMKASYPVTEHGSFYLECKEIRKMQ